MGDLRALLLVRRVVWLIVIVDRYHAKSLTFTANIHNFQLTVCERSRPIIRFGVLVVAAFGIHRHCPYNSIPRSSPLERMRGVTIFIITVIRGTPLLAIVLIG